MTTLTEIVETLMRQEVAGQPVRTLDEMPELPPQPIAPIPKSPEAAHDPAHDRFLPEVQQKAAAGQCAGDCEKHVGPVTAVRVGSQTHDWGYFAYCDEAKDEDTRRGLIVVEAA